jgi:cold shock CspA family protein
MVVAAFQERTTMENTRIDVAQNNSRNEVVARKPSRAPKMNATTKGRAKGVKPAERGHRMTGRIVRVLHGQSHGFIRAEDNRQVFFHRSDVRFALFNALAVRDRVVFEVIEDKIAGARAVKVKRAASKKRKQ